MTADNTALLNKIEQEAAAMEKEKHVCARCTLYAVGKNLKLADETCLDAALKAAIPMSGGIAGTRNQCGALVGGIMAIGMGMVAYDPKTANPEQRKVVMGAAKEFYRWFEKEIGHVRCYDIRDAALGRSFDTSDPGETEKFVAAGGYELCSGVVGKAARKAAEVILQSRKA